MSYLPHSYLNYLCYSSHIKGKTNFFLVCVCAVQLAKQKTQHFNSSSRWFRKNYCFL